MSKLFLVSCLSFTFSMTFCEMYFTYGVRMLGFVLFNTRITNVSSGLVVDES